MIGLIVDRAGISRLWNALKFWRTTLLIALANCGSFQSSERTRDSTYCMMNCSVTETGVNHASLASRYQRKRPREKISRSAQKEISACIVIGQLAYVFI